MAYAGINTDINNSEYGKDYAERVRDNFFRDGFAKKFNRFEFKHKRSDIIETDGEIVAKDGVKVEPKPKESKLSKFKAFPSKLKNSSQQKVSKFKSDFNKNINYIKDTVRRMKDYFAQVFQNLKGMEGEPG